MEKKDTLELSSVWKEIELDYEVVSVLGKGAFGTVAKARCRLTSQIVAIKLLQDCFGSIYSSK
jgi:serine/threonine protein kinase